MGIGFSWYGVGLNEVTGVLDLESPLREEEALEEGPGIWSFGEGRSATVVGAVTGGGMGVVTSGVSG